MDFNGNTVSTESTVVAKGKRDEENTVSATDINEDLSIEVFKISLHETEIHPLKRRLIVLDINGLLAAVVSSPPKDRKPDITIGRRATEGGELRVFLEGLTKAEDMRKYVEEHPFGQEAISKTSDSWNFYSQVIESLSAEKAMSDLKRK
ncbi:hypothetical protein VIGAN_11058600 [Vigna angularis var. angularis]|uniref:FCP1 homology domain-containing protein n=1 Tax=Vigna angularis var. angularis TaxID=157739 RepID=A0A0S3T8N2_PHAAN|nr:hypothetical protein VIGAN_11058600 [Vigna angularis var. angularis]